jgi:hypothetical protein
MNHISALHLFTLNPHLNYLACDYIFNPLSKRVNLHLCEVFDIVGREATSLRTCLPTFHL